jgi:two-component system KDP operon response regulator KdpE
MDEGPKRVLVADDEPSIRRFLRTLLEAHQYSVQEARSAQEAIERTASFRPDVLVLDVGLPDMDGTEVVRVLREWSRVPILILSVRSAERDKIAALDNGADDYLTKPFGSGELLARIRACLRRSEQVGGEPVFKAGDLLVDLKRRRVEERHRDIQLTPTEYELLRCLVLNAGMVLTHRHLLRAVWGNISDQDVHLLRVNMSNLRRKIEPEPARPRYILTEPGVGYRLLAEQAGVD